MTFKNASKSGKPFKRRKEGPEQWRCYWTKNNFLSYLRETEKGFQETIPVLSKEDIEANGWILKDDKVKSN